MIALHYFLAYSEGIASSWPAKTSGVVSRLRRTSSAITSRGSAEGASCCATCQSVSPDATVTYWKPALDPEKKVTCVTTQETGSLITRHKSCFTKKQWRYVNDAHNDEARHLADDNRGRLSGN